MFKRQAFIMNTKVNAFFCMALVLFHVMNCCALDSYDIEQMVASEMMQPFDLKIVMKAIIDDALQKNMLRQLPQGFLAFYEALEQGSSVIQYADLIQALPVIFTAIMPEMMQRIYHHEKQKVGYTIKNVSENDVHFK